MRRSLLTALLFVFSVCLGSSVCLLVASPALAQVAAATSDVPDCISIVPPPLIAGNSIGRYIVTVRDAASIPVPGAQVQVEFPPTTIPMIAWCGGIPPGAPPGVLNGTTNAAGVVEFDIFGGGCVTSAMQPCAAPAAIVRVAGPPGLGGNFAEEIFCINSPDAVDDFGAPPACPGKSTCLGGVTKAGLSDAVFHTPCIKGGLICPCTKFTAPYGAPVNLGDAVLLTPFIKAGNICGC